MKQKRKEKEKNVDIYFSSPCRHRDYIYAADKTEKIMDKGMQSNSPLSFMTYMEQRFVISSLFFTNFKRKQLAH